MKHKRYFRWALIGLVALLGVAVFCPVKFTFGETHVLKTLKHTSDDSDVIPQGCYHMVWDAPTGMNSSGEYWGVRAGNWVIQLDIWTGES